MCEYGEEEIERLAKEIDSVVAEQSMSCPRGSTYRKFLDIGERRMRITYLPIFNIGDSVFSFPLSCSMVRLNNSKGPVGPPSSNTLCIQGSLGSAFSTWSLKASRRGTRLAASSDNLARSLGAFLTSLRYLEEKVD